MSQSGSTAHSQEDIHMGNTDSSGMAAEHAARTWAYQESQFPASNEIDRYDQWPVDGSQYSLHFNQITWQTNLFPAYCAVRKAVKVDKETLPDTWIISPTMLYWPAPDTPHPTEPYWYVVMDPKLLADTMQKASEKWTARLTAIAQMKTAEAKSIPEPTVSAEAESSVSAEEKSPEDLAREILQSAQEEVMRDAYGRAHGSAERSGVSSEFSLSTKPIATVVDEGRTSARGISQHVSDSSSVFKRFLFDSKIPDAYVEEVVKHLKTKNAFASSFDTKKI